MEKAIKKKSSKKAASVADFEPAKVGLLVALVGVVSLVLFALIALSNS